MVKSSRFNRYRLSLVFVLFTLGGFPSYTTAQGDAAYPKWFRSMPSSGQHLWAVGYAPAYVQEEMGVKEAKADVYDRLRRTRRTTIEGERLFESLPGREIAFRGQDFTVTELPDTLQSVSYVDSVRTGDMTLVLAAWSPDGSKPTLPRSFRRRAAFSEKQPDWTQQSPENNSDMYRAVGIAPRHYRPENGWQLAENRARRRLALRAATDVRILKLSNGKAQHVVESARTEVRLRHTQTVARWADKNTCYVLVEGVVDEVLIE